MVVEPLRDIPPNLPATPGPLRLADYLALPDEPRCELLHGRLFVTAAPHVRHQEVAMYLARELDVLCRARGGRLLAGPVDVVLRDDTVVQPDLCWISPARRNRVGARIAGAPDLVVEVLSPGSERIDRTLKLDLYSGSDISEYWIVDPWSRLVEIYSPGPGGVRVASFATGKLDSQAFPEVSIDLDRLWQGLDDWSPAAAPSG